MQNRETKQMLRQVLKKRRSALSKEYCEESDEAIQRRLTETEIYKKAAVIGCYVGMDQEIHTMPIMEDALRSGKRVGAPKCMGKGKMEFYEIRSLEELEPGSFGILEPGESSRLMSKTEIQLMIVPCLSCTLSGVRLGYGGGYYDRYLEEIHCECVALCRQSMVSDSLPKEDHDRGMTLIITESTVSWCDLQ